MSDTPRGLDTSRPFTRAEALAAGIEPSKAPAGRFTRIFNRVYIGADVPLTPVVRAQAALKLFGPGGFASHVSAARVYAVPVPAIPDEHVTVTDPRERRRPAGVVPHVNPTPEVRTHKGVCVSAPAQMFVELVAWCEASADAGARAARRAAAYVRERVDSPMETRLRMLLLLAGLPEPLVNITVTDAAGTPVRRYDLCWPAVRVIVEYDGRHHIEREDSWEADLARREAIDEDGWRILVVTSRGIYREPERTVSRVWRLLRERGLAGVPATPREDWRPHFPTR